METVIDRIDDALLWLTEPAAPTRCFVFLGGVTLLCVIGMCAVLSVVIGAFR